MNPDECQTNGCIQRCHELSIEQTRSAVLAEVTPDQEVWTRNAVMKAIEMGIAISTQEQVRADEILKDCGIRGVAVGATIEILNTLGLRPEGGFVNLGDFEI